MFLALSGQIESQLREAYARKYETGCLNQSVIAEKLGINRSAVHHRLMGQTNMTIETIADMVWALDHDIIVRIYDPSEPLSGNDRPNAAPPPAIKLTQTGSRKDDDGATWHTT
jgi:predicted XRE-type DNA-binding protein